jgi:hypothetical protein
VATPTNTLGVLNSKRTSRPSLPQRGYRMQQQVLPASYSSMIVQHSSVSFRPFSGSIRVLPSLSTRSWQLIARRGEKLSRYKSEWVTFHSLDTMHTV